MRFTIGLIIGLSVSGVCLPVAQASCDDATDASPEDDCDEDGVSIGEGDCDDEDPEVFPGAEELCDDEIDNNCNDQIDEMCVESLDQGTLGGGSVCGVVDSPLSLFFIPCLLLRRRRSW